MSALTIIAAVFAVWFVAIGGAVFLSGVLWTAIWIAEQIDRLWRWLAEHWNQPEE